jgi:hypothetical protein
MIDIDKQIAEVRREVQMRRKVYRKFVEQDRMSQATADDRIATMQAVVDTLELVRAHDAPDELGPVQNSLLDHP